MNEYCIDLNFNFSPLHNHIDLQNMGFENYWNLIPTSHLNHKLIKLFLELDLDFPQAAIFYSNGSATHPIHADYYYPTDVTKINWVFGPDHIMNWYKTSKINAHSTWQGKNFVPYNSNEVELVHSQKVSTPSLIQVGIPHNVVNFSGNRICVSVALFYRRTKKQLTMQEARTLFKNYIV